MAAQADATARGTVPRGRLTSDRDRLCSGPLGGGAPLAHPVGMTLQCPACGAAIPPSGINIDRLVAACASCAEVFPFEPKRGRKRRTVASVPRPASSTVSGDVAPGHTEPAYRERAARSAPGTLTLRRRWFSAQTIFLLFFAILWDGFLVFWYATALESADALMLAFPLLHVAAGGLVTYGALTGLFNHSEITVGAETLSVRHGPLPWPGNVVVPTSELRQLFVRQRVSRGENGTSTTYALCADIGGVTKDLLRSLTSQDEARYLEQTIEAHLSIEDDPTAGDV